MIVLRLNQNLYLQHRVHSTSTSILIPFLRPSSTSRPVRPRTWSAWPRRRRRGRPGFWTLGTGPGPMATGSSGMFLSRCFPESRCLMMVDVNFNNVSQYDFLVSAVAGMYATIWLLPRSTFSRPERLCPAGCRQMQRLKEELKQKDAEPGSSEGSCL